MYFRADRSDGGFKRVSKRPFTHKRHIPLSTIPKDLKLYESGLGTQHRPIFLVGFRKFSLDYIPSLVESGNLGNCAGPTLEFPDHTARKRWECCRRESQDPALRFIRSALQFWRRLGKA
jgi:hypothetical protein